MVTHTRSRYAERGVRDERGMRDERGVRYKR
jgi:hypothetical protein